MNINENTYNTPEYLRRITLEWTKVTKEEKIEVEILAGVRYAFGSELACLRLAYGYRGATNIRMGYSENRQTWYFCLEPKY